MLVSFLSSRHEQLRRSANVNEAPTIPELYADPAVLAANPQYPLVQKVFRAGAVFRPSRQAGMMYPEVSRAYFEAVHTVLIGKKSASKAASDLEVELGQMLKAIPGNPNARAYGDASAAQQ